MYFNIYIYVYIYIIYVIYNIYISARFAMVCMLIWPNFDSFAIAYLISAACSKNFIFQ